MAINGEEEKNSEYLKTVLTIGHFTFFSFKKGV
jgi:hypothetical protein